MGGITKPKQTIVDIAKQYDDVTDLWLRPRLRQSY